MHLHAKDCENYYCSQVGSGNSYFRGIAHQRGYGFFGDLRRYITPLVIKAGNYLGKQLFQTGKNVLSDVSTGTSFRDSTRHRFREASNNVKNDIFSKLQQGQGIKRKRKKRTRQSKTKRCKKAQTDIFS